MYTETIEVLPYRSDPDQLARWVEARARGRASAQLRELDLAPKTMEGTLATAGALGFWDRDSQELTPTGQRFALASDAERRSLLRSSIRDFAPFGYLLRAIATRPQRSVTDSTWIETWWATHGFGSSQSNRVEATAVFGRFVEYVGWGRYVPGRRGHPTRIEWTEEAFADSAGPGGTSDHTAPAPPARAAERSAPAATVSAASEPIPEEAPSTPLSGGYNRIVIPLRSGETARLEVPMRLSREEKRRLVELLDLLITVEDTRD